LYNRELEVLKTKPFVEQCENKFFFEFVQAVRSYLACGVEERPYHVLNGILDLSDKDAAARLALMFKEGSFNPYGNGQTASVQFFEPRIEQTITGWSCVGTAIANKNVIAISGTGATASDAFTAWCTSAQNQLSVWAPQDNFPLFDFVRSLPAPSTEHPFSQVWTLPPLEAKRYLRMVFFNEGGFNPYGNGQTSSVGFSHSDFSSPGIDYEKILFSSPSHEVFPFGVFEHPPLPPIVCSYLLEFGFYHDSLRENVDDLNEFFNSFDIDPVDEIEWFNLPINHPGPPQTPDDGSVDWFVSNCGYFPPPVMREGVFNQYGNEQISLLFLLCFFYFIMTKEQYQKSTGFTGDILNSKYSKLKERERLKKDATRKPNMNANKTKSPAAKHMPKATKKLPTKNARQVTDMSMCSQSYAVALNCPFFFLDETCAYKLGPWAKNRDKLPLPCIPLPPNIKSKKMQAFARFTVNVNASGNFFIVMRPRYLANDINSFNSSGFCQCSGPAYIGTTTLPILDTGAAVTTGITNIAVNSEFSMADLVLSPGLAGISYRIVGAAFRFRYTGPVMQESGVFHTVSEPDHYSLSGLDLGTLSGYDNYNKYTTTDKWVTVCYSPVSEDEFNYQPDWFMNPSTHAVISSSSYNACYAVIGTGLPQGAYIDAEAVMLVEVTGRIVRGKTATTVDPIGTAVVLNSSSADTSKMQNDPKVTIPEIIKPGATETSFQSLVSGAVGTIAKDVLTAM